MQLKMAQTSFLLLLFGISLLYSLMLLPLLTAILWAGLIAVLFHPLQLRLKPYFGGHRNLLALTVLLICIFMVILPFSGVVIALVREAAIFYEKVNMGDFDLIGYVDKSVQIPKPVENFLNHFGITLDGLRQSVKDAARQSSSFIASQALSIGQNTAHFVFTAVLLLYLTFFFLRDGEMLVQQLVRGLPLGEKREQLLINRISEVINAVVRGGLMVATVQGTLGGIMFWILGVQAPLLWGSVMIVASLIPAIGSSLIWAPVGVYLLMKGLVWQGIVMLLFGFFVISLVDNILRPILVGRGTGVPDYLILVSTLGGIFMFGVNGFVLGPLIIALFISIWGMFIKEYKPL